MVTINNLTNKLKGKAQQLKGKVEVASGKPLKGNYDKLIGRVNEITADIEGGDYYDG